MSDREALLQYIGGLSDHEAHHLWQRIQCEAANPPEPLTAEERALVERALASSDAGRRVSLEDARRRFGVA